MSDPKPMGAEGILRQLTNGTGLSAGRPTFCSTCHHREAAIMTNKNGDSYRAWGCLPCIERAKDNAEDAKRKSGIRQAAAANEGRFNKHPRAR